MREASHKELLTESATDADALSIMHFDLQKMLYELSAIFRFCRYNFNIFPRQETVDNGSSSVFMCQTNSLEFLAGYQFDFNTCIKEGISSHTYETLFAVGRLMSI